MPKPVSKQKQTEFDRIRAALSFIQANAKKQPSLEEIAASVGMSPQHFQRMFTAWAGTSPKKFLQYISLEHAKAALQDGATLQKATSRAGLSGSGRLHDLFVTIEGMTPGEFKNGGAALTISYSFAATPFGSVIIASTSKGVCYLAFVEERKHAVDLLKDKFPNATFQEREDALQRKALAIFRKKSQLSDIKLHLKGTSFQLKVWEALLRIPEGKLSTYGKIAFGIRHPNAFRAVGTAVGQNPVAFLIPCHRVIQSSGVLGNYHWGSDLKAAMIGWEGTKTEDLPR